MIHLLWPWVRLIDEHYYRRASPDLSQVRVMVEEKPRMEGHRPAMVVDEQGRINIIPTKLWEKDPNVIHVLSHETLHIVIRTREPGIEDKLDNLPLHKTDELFARGGVYGWELQGMKWKEEMLN